MMHYQKYGVLIPVRRDCAFDLTNEQFGDEKLNFLDLITLSFLRTKYGIISRIMPQTTRFVSTPH